MIIVYGTRFWGHSDAIDGVGHVACRFVHIMFVPLVPIETMFLLPGDRGVKVPFSFKAAMSGWLRGGAILTAIGSIVGAVAGFAEGQIIAGVASAVVAGISIGAFPLIGKIFGSCSQQRRAELLGLLGMSDQAGASPQTPHQVPQQPQYGQPQHGQPQYGQPPYGQPPYGQPPYGQPQPQPGMMQPAGGFGAPPGYGPPPQMHAPQAPSFGPPQQGYGAPPGYGPPQGYDPNRR